MSAVVCPWCQSEIIQEEGREPDKICPFCDNEIDGYRTLRVTLGDEEDEENEADEEAIGEENEIVSIDDDEDLGWLENEPLESNEELERFEETLEELLDEQEVVPECPSCREYMIEIGERVVSAPEFRSRVPDTLGQPLVKAPFALTTYVCPSCFATQSFLGDDHRQAMVRRLSQDLTNRYGKENDQ